MYIKVVTHSGLFHTDEVFACAAISIYHSDDCVDIIRSRNPVDFDSADYVVDVGGKYDGAKYFDHHQRGFGEARPNGVKYSSFGLVWKLLGEKIAESEEIADLVDQNLVQFIDQVDNGQVSVPEGVYSLSRVISGFNPTWVEDASEEFRFHRFTKAVETAKTIICNEISSCYGKLIAKQQLLEAQTLMGGKVLQLDKFCPWQDYIHETNPEAEFVLFPDISGEWRIQAVPVKSGSFESKKKLPLHWGGLSDEELVDATGIPDATFCHPGLFIAGAKSQEGILQMAKLATQT